jgi:carboxypeptidase Q
MFALRRAVVAACVVFVMMLPLSAADKKDKNKPAATAQPSYELPQPEHETLDYTMYDRIRDEGIAHSHIMEYA